MIGVELVIAATAGAAAVMAATVAALRLIPHQPTPDSTKAVRGELADLQRQFLDFQDKYELTVTRNVAKVGKLRRKIANLQDEEEPDDEDVGPCAPAAARPAQEAPLSKAQMYTLAANAKVI